MEENAIVIVDKVNKELEIAVCSLNGKTGLVPLKFLKVSSSMKRVYENSSKASKREQRQKLRQSQVKK